MLSRAHWEPANGDCAHNKHYCSKPVVDCHCKHCDNPVPERRAGPWEHGEPAHQRQGERVDLVKFREAVKSGKRLREIAEDDELLPTLTKYPRIYEKLSSIYRPALDRDVEVHLLYGPTGCGKSTEAYRFHEDFWDCDMDGATWLDGYDGQAVAIFDDFGGASSHTRLDKLLKLLHRWIGRGAIKGGHIWWRPTTVFITTNIHPRDWYKYEGREAQYSALQRRVTRLDTWRADGSRRDPLLPGSRGFEAFWTTFDISARSAPPQRADGLMGGYLVISRPGDESRLYDWLDDHL